MNPEARKLYDLLPAVYRIHDEERGAPLEALLSVIAEQIAVLRENLDQLYDDEFIETCADWVAPYIGDLVGYRPLREVTGKTRSGRAEVANTIAYRRRKGTAAVLEQLGRDVTGWHARAVEFFLQLVTTQYMNHIRGDHHYAPDVRDWERLERLGTAFGAIPHTIDVRRIETQKGRYNIPNVGVFLWRLDAYPLRRSPAFPVDAERFLFSPLGNDTRLFTRPQTEDEITHLAEPLNVPEPLSRRVLHAHLERYYGEGRSLFVEADGVDTAISNVQVCDLSDEGSGWAHVPASKVSLDPVLGRVAFPSGSSPQNVRASLHYGFSMPMGGGEYERRASFVLTAAPNHALTQGQSVQSALTAVLAGGIVQIDDNGRYEETPAVIVGTEASVEFRAANEHRPTIVLGGDWTVQLAAGAELSLNGLLITGGTLRVVTAAGDGPRLLRLRHCTLVPGLALTREGEPVSSDAPGLIVDQPDTTVEIDRSIAGGIRAVRGVTVKVKNSIVDATADTRVAFSHPDGLSPGGVFIAENATVVGKVNTARLELASNTIFFARLAETDPWAHPVHSDQNQQGCVRFSFVPRGSVVPRRYRCQPDLAVAQAIRAAEKQQGALTAQQKEAIARGVRSRVTPSFTTLRYGRAAYAQLRTACPVEIRLGADDESEMGVFHDVFWPQREANLRIRLEEYLRFGLEAGILYATQE